MSFRAISKVFPDGTHAIEHADLEVAHGSIAAIVGPSGCGKSTLLRIAADLTTASAGEVEVAERPLGFVFQDPTLLPWRDVRGNVELLAELHHLPKAERRRRAAEAIELTGLSGFERHLPRALSGGMRMRASLARTLTLAPRVLLLDEPFGALDEITRERLNEELLRLHQAAGFSALLVTHSVVEAVFIASRIMIMSSRPGRIVTTLDVPFPYPRDASLRSDPAVLCVRGRSVGSSFAGWSHERGQPTGLRHHALRWLPPLIVFACVIGVWFFVSYVLLDPSRRFLLPPPQQVVQIGLLQWASLHPILDALWQSVKVALTGLVIAAVIGFAFAIAMSQARWAERALYPWAVVLQTVPILAIVPLIGFWFQYGFWSRVLVCTLISLFPIITNTLFGLKSASHECHELFTLNHATRRQTTSPASSFRGPSRRSSPA